MKKLLLAFTASLLFGASLNSVINRKPQIKIHKQSYDKYSLIIKYKKNAPLELLDSINGIKKIKPYKALNRHLNYSLAHVKLLKTANVDEVVSKLKSFDFIISVERDEIFQKESIPNDPLFDQQWYLKDDYVPNKDINVTGVWDISTGSDEVVVAVLDSGVNLLHEDLRDNLYVNEKELNGQAGVDDDGNGYVDDIYGYDFAYDLSGENHSLIEPVGSHGTSVAGIIGAVGNNALGISGVNWHVKILPVKVMRPDGGFYSNDVLEGIDYIIKLKQSGVNIVAVNASYGGYYENYDVFQSSATKDAIKALGDNSIAFFTSAGNTARNNDAIYYDYTKLPASYNLSNIVAVASISPTQERDKSSYSNYGEKTVQISAGGSGILTTYNYIEGNESVDNSIYYEDFENGFLDWQTFGGWYTDDENYHSYSHSISDSSGNYDDTQSTYIISKEFNLTSYKNSHIAVDFCFSAKLKWNDWFKVYFYDGKEWDEMKYFASTDGWKCAGIPIPESFKNDNFKIKFAIVPTDDNQTDDGVYIDDVKIGYYTKTNAYEFATGTSMASPVGCGGYALLDSVYPHEDMYEKLSRIIGNGQKPSFPITGVRLNMGMAVDGSVRPYILNTKEVKTVSREFDFEVKNVNSPKVYSNDKEVNFTYKDGVVHVILPDSAGREITVKENNISSANKLFVSYWKINLRMPAMHYNGNDVSVYDGKIYIYGGEDFFAKDTQYMDIYDTVTKTWKKGAKPEDDFSFATSKAVDSYVYFLGGKNSEGEFLSNVKKYSVTDDSWSDSITLPEKFAFARSVLINKEIYTIGGVDANSTPLGVIYRFDTQDGSFEKYYMKEARELPGVCVFRGKVYIFGGIGNSKNTVTTAEVFDPSSNESRYIADMPESLYALNCVNVNDKYILLFSGMDNLNFYSSDVIKYYPDKDTYEVLKSSVFEPVLPVFDVSDKLVVNDGILYYMGGMVNDSAVVGTSSFEEMNISTFDEYNVSYSDINLTQDTDENETENISSISAEGSGGGFSLPAFDFIVILFLLGGGLFITRR